MELQRRIGHGRLSEVLGEAALPQDRFLRTVGFGRAARAAWTTTPDWAKAQDRRLHRRRQRVHRHASRRRAAAGVHAARLRAGAVDRARRHRVGEDDGLGPSARIIRSSCCVTISLPPVGAERMAQLMPPYPTNGLSVVGGSGGSGGLSGSGKSGGSGGSGGLGVTYQTYQTHQTSSGRAHSPRPCPQVIPRSERFSSARPRRVSAPTTGWSTAR